MIDDNFVFKKGKYAGITYGLVRRTNPSYIEWVKENAPGLLKEPQKKEPKTAPERIDPPISSGEKKSAIRPNLNFLNEKNKDE